MSGNAWKYSHQVDEQDLRMMQREYISLNQAVEYYGFGMKPMTRLAREAGAVYKFGPNFIRIRRDIFEAYLRKIQVKED